MTTSATVACASCGAAPDPESGRIRHKATTPVPSMDTVEAWIMDEDYPEATDGCTVDPDGRCEHGHQSWLLRLGLI